MISPRETIHAEHQSDPTLDRTEEVFCESGLLVSKLNLEHRPEQEQMALASAQAFQLAHPLLFEAGTGVGKSLAYLIPAIIRAVESKRQCLVSTHTISLQEQIQEKDLPLCRTLLSSTLSLSKYAGFRFALLVGRGNYLCTTRLARALETKLELFHSVEQDELRRIADWAKDTKTGLQHDLNPAPPGQVWQWVSADARACNRRNCNPKFCFFQSARARLRKAHLIVLNHSLLFSLMNTASAPKGDTPGLLFPNDFAVLDEGHTVPSVATEQFGHRISSYGIDRLLKRLFNPRNNKGIFALFGSEKDCRAVEKAINKAEEFFSSIRQELLCNQDVARVYRQGWCEPILNPSLRDLITRLSERANKIEDEQEREELLDLRQQLSGYQHGINECITLDDEGQVYWVERSGRQGRNVTLRTAPIDVAPHLRERLFLRKTAVLVTSATLAEGPRFDGFSERIGATGFPAEQVRSTFDFANQMRVFCAGDAPPPTRENSSLHLEYLSEMITFCSLRVRGGSLVLFTSYTDMHGVARLVENALTTAGRTLLMQGRDGSRTRIATRFASLGNAALFGTDSFWAGVDVPGPALSQVIITRLPFENPNHPIVEARGEWIRSHGGNPFTEMTLPDAVLKLRQGVGRLIRKISDKGNITILDSRILTREYGRRFLDILPVREFTRFSRSDRSTLFLPI